jgi:hypothetical protein
MLVRRSRVYVFACICMYWCCIFDFFSMYVVCIVCIWQNVSVSMRLATFVAENTSKYIQYRQIQTSYIHQFYQHTYKNTYKISQLLCVSMCIYAHVFACICLCVSMCMYYYVTMCIYVHVFTWSDVHLVCACICMYLYVSTDCHCSPVVICVRLGYIEHYVLQSEREGTICFEILFYFSKGDSRVVRGPNHGPRVDVVQGAAWAGLATQIAHAPFVARVLAAMHDSGNGAVIPCRNERQHADTDTIPTDTCTYMHIPTFHT